MAAEQVADDRVRLALIWAMGENRVIGRGDTLPWRLPGEMQYFRAVTLGKPVIMGRRTFESLAKPLPGRTNIVVSRSLAVRHPRVRVVPSVEEAVHIGRAQAEVDGMHEIMVIGGAQIYAATLRLADRLYMTVVHAEPEGDTFFPQTDLEAWQEVRRVRVPADADNVYDFSLVLLERP